jgi:ATP-dependent Clp protease ATP-binding subunit ClpC
MTSNLGTEFVRKSGSLGFLQPGDNGEDREAHRKIEKALKDNFRPEFLNRIDEIITFSQLSLEDMQKIVILQMKEIHERISDQGLDVVLVEEAGMWLAEQGYDPDFGARPLKRALQKFVESPLSIKILEGEFVAGDTVEVGVNDEKDGMSFTLKERKGKAELTRTEEEVAAK